jgi:hypothetical protein
MSYLPGNSPAQASARTNCTGTRRASARFFAGKLNRYRADVAPGNLQVDSQTLCFLPEAQGEITRTSGYIKEGQGLAGEFGQLANGPPEDSGASAPEIDSLQSAQGAFVRPRIDARIVHDFGLAMPVAQSAEKHDWRSRSVFFAQARWRKCMEVRPPSGGPQTLRPEFAPLRE